MRLLGFQKKQCGKVLWPVLALCLSLGVAIPVSHADGVSNLPSLGDAGSGELSVQEERKLGELIMQDYRSMGQINEDPEITAFLNRLGGKIVQSAGESPSDFHFFLVSDKTINAFALPGGYIGVNTGLLAATQTESELASVLAHEVGHVTQRHIARMYGNQKQTSLVSMAAVIAAVLVAGSNADAAQGLVAAGMGYSAEKQLSFSRDAEQEADRVGFSTLEQAGFDPKGMVDFFGRLQKNARLYENNAPAYLRTHPLTAQRIADIQNRASWVKRQAFYEDNSLEFALVRVKAMSYGVTTTQARQELLKRLAAPLQQEAIADPVVLAYGRAQLLADLGKPAQAVKVLDEAIELLSRSKSVVRVSSAPSMLATLRLNMQVALLNSGKDSFVPAREESKLNASELAFFKELEQFRSRYSTGMAERLAYAEGLQQLGLHHKAEVYLRQWREADRANVDLYELSAKTAQALGKQAEQHLFLAQAYGMRGAWLPAIEQTRIARNLAKDDYYLSAEIDAKQREYKQKVDEQREQQRQK